MTLELTLIGRGCVDSNNALRSILVSEGIEDCVILAGSKENIGELLADFDFFVCHQGPKVFLIVYWRRLLHLYLAFQQE